jgi:hypothetical protein
MTGCTVGVKISGSGNDKEVAIGGLAGIIFVESSIDASSATGDVEGSILTGSDRNIAVGGLVGVGGGYITNSHATGNVSVTASVSGTGDEVKAGGLAGHLEGIIENCYATGNVSSVNTGSGNVEVIAGGLVGQAEDDGGVAATINKSYASGTVSATGKDGSVNAGGIAGLIYNDAEITDSYYAGPDAGTAVTATATGSASTYAGGIAGRINGNNNYIIERCYAKGNISAASGTAGGIAGEGYGGSIRKSAALSASVSGASANRVAPSGATLTNNIANSAMTGGSFSDKTANGSDGANVSVPVPQTTFQTTLVWDFTNAWKMQGSYPVLQWQP